jgi:hypothetical protein
VLARFGSLTFAKRWLVCRAKDNVPNVGRLSAFLSCGLAKKLNLFSFIVIFVFHSQTILQSFSLSLSFLRLVGNFLVFYPPSPQTESSKVMKEN